MYAECYPKVQVKITESISWSDTFGLLKRGEIHLGQNLLRAAQPGDARLSNQPLKAIDLMAASHEPLPLDKAGQIEVERLTLFPLLLWIRASLRAVPSMLPAASRASSPTLCSKPDAAHLAGDGRRRHGVVVAPSAVPVNRCTPLHAAASAPRGVRASRWPFSRMPAVLSPGYVPRHCERLAQARGQVFPITRPSKLVAEEPIQRTRASRRGKSGRPDKTAERCQGHELEAPRAIEEREQAPRAGLQSQPRPFSGGQTHYFLG